MMHVFIIVIVGMAHAADRGYQLDLVNIDGLVGWRTTFIYLGALLCVLGAQLLLTMQALRALGTGGSDAVRAIARAERALPGAHLSIVVVHAAFTLCLGWPQTVAMLFGARHVVFLEFAIMVVPALAAIVVTWVIHEPLLRRLRGSAMLADLDAGELIQPPMPSRGASIMNQVRVQMLFILLPVLLIILISDLVNLWLGDTSLLAGVLTLVGAASVFFFAPLLARFTLTLEPVPAGPLRDRLVQVCTQHGVGVRELLLWKTGGAMMNAAVMGLVARFRYVLLTDALVNMLETDEVEAVMAHEIGHARRRHIPWLVAAMLAIITIPSVAFDLTFRAVDSRWQIDQAMYQWIEVVAMVAIAVTAFVLFGWVSRRFERQADTFAVQHLSGMHREQPKNGEGAALVTDVAARTVIHALGSIGSSSGIRRKQRSWRHGSIKSRQEYLAGLVGQPLHRLAIDRVVGRIKLVSAILLLAMTAFAIYDSRAMQQQPAQDAQAPFSLHSQSAARQ
ncbi:MAG: M48 family metallopeptidase [Phycisphaerales bacterium]